MSQIIDSRGWVLQESDTSAGYVGYANQRYAKLYMIAQEVVNGSVTSTRYHIADADFKTDWDNRASLDYKYWSDLVTNFGKLIGRYS